MTSHTLAPARQAAWQTAMQGWTRALVAMALGLTTTLLIHGETVGDTVSMWTGVTTYKYAWAVLPTLAYVLWHNRARYVQLTPTGSALGVAAAVAFTLAWIVSDIANIAAGRQLSVVAAMGAVVLAAVGWSVFRVLAPMLALLLFLVPIGDGLLIPLKQITVGFVSIGGAISGLPFSTDGFAIYIGPQRYVVIDACAGLHYVLVGSFLGLTLALLIYRSWWKTAALTLLGACAGVLANGVRVISIVLYDRAIGGPPIDLATHSYFEWPGMIVGFGLLFIIYGRLEVEPARNASGWGSARGRATLGCCSAALFAVAAIAAGPIVSRGAPQAPAEGASIDVLPETVSGWTKRDTSSNWRPRVLADTVSTDLAEYVKRGQSLTLFVAQANTRDAKLSGGAVEFVDDPQWMPGQRREFSACAAARCYAGWQITFLLRGTERVRHVYIVNAIGAETTTSVLEFRLRRVWADLSRELERPRLVAIATDAMDGIDTSELGALLHALIGDAGVATHTRVLAENEKAVKEEPRKRGLSWHESAESMWVSRYRLDE